MENQLLDNETRNIINTLAEQLHLSEAEVLKQALYDYRQKHQKPNHLLSFAGILTEEEAEDLLNTIQQNRSNKDFFQDLWNTFLIPISWSIT